MAAGSKRRWLLLAVLAGAGAWFVRSRMAGPRGLTGPVRVLPADPIPAGPAPTTAVTPGEPVAAWDSAAPSPEGTSWSAPAVSATPSAPSDPAPTAPPAAPAAPAAATAAGAPAPAAPEPMSGPVSESTSEPEVAAPEVAAAAIAADAEREAAPPASATRPRPSPVPRASKPAPSKPAPSKAETPKAETPKTRSPEPRNREPMPSGQALFAPPAAESTSGATPLPDGSAPGPEYTIKGNADSMLFHSPDSPYFKRTKAEVWFRDADEARAAGFTEWAPRKRATQ